MPYQLLKLDIPEPAVAVVRLNRPDAANALNAKIALELKHFFTHLPKGTRAVVLTGEGKHFCAGADLKERKGMTKAAWQKQHHAFEGAMRAVLASPVPVIAAVNGAAFGGGLELALACDFIYAADAARFGQSETSLGIMPGMGGTQQLPRAVGARRARELIFTAQAFTAEQAHEWDMINRLCLAEKLLEEAIACAKTIAANAPLAIATARKSMREGASLSLLEALGRELKYYNTLLTTKDRHEGINAFNEKRKPRFTGA